MTKDKFSPSTAPTNALYRYYIQVGDVSTTPLTESHNTQGAYGVEDIVWVKTPHGRCTIEFRMVHVTQVNSPQSVQVDEILHHVKDLCPFMGSNPSSGHNSDSEENEQLVNLRSTSLGECDDSQ